MDSSHVVFFFGSGVSIPSGMPSVNKITQAVLTGPLIFTEHKRYVFPSSIGTSSLNDEIPHGSSSEYIARLRGLLSFILRHAQTVLIETEKFDQKVTYEDLYHLCAQVVSDRTAAEDKPVGQMNFAVHSFSERLQQEAKPFLLNDPDGLLDDLAYTAREATFLITGVVRELLNIPVEKIEGFQPLLQAIHELDRVTIITLNHDLLVEQFLHRNGIGFEDGFAGKLSEVRNYEPSRLFDESAEVTVIKPHGSINWYIDHDTGSYVAQPIADPAPHPLDLSRFLKPEPSILSGHEKEKRYNTDIFGDMIDALVYALRDTNIVVESGFGWRDYGMYHQLLRYLGRRQEHRILLLHPEEDFSEYHPISLSRLNFTSMPPGLIKSIPNYMCETSWDKIKEALGLP